MNTTPDGFAERLRHYVTLISQGVPFIVIALNLNAANASRVGLLLAPLLLATVGPILELAGRRTGRTLTLTGLGVQFVGAVVLVTLILSSNPGGFKLSARDLPGIALIAGLILEPAALFVWNFLAGRRPQPAGAAPA